MLLHCAWMGWPLKVERWNVTTQGCKHVSIRRHNDPYQPREHRCVALASSHQSCTHSEVTCAVYIVYIVYVVHVVYVVYHVMSCVTHQPRVFFLIYDAVLRHGQHDGGPARSVQVLQFCHKLFECMVQHILACKMEDNKPPSNFNLFFCYVFQSSYFWNLTVSAVIGSDAVSEAAQKSHLAEATHAS